MHAGRRFPVLPWIATFMAVFFAMFGLVRYYLGKWQANDAQLRCDLVIAVLGVLGSVACTLPYSFAARSHQPPLRVTRLPRRGACRTNRA